MADKKLVDARQEHYRQIHNSLDPERMIELFTDDVDYSDHGLGVTGLKKEALRELVTNVFGSCKGLEFTTVSVNGSREFSAWEWTAVGVLSKEMPGLPIKVGDEFKMMGCSLFWWDGSGDDAKSWNIKKEVEYSKML